MKKIFYCDADGIIFNSKKRMAELINLHYRAFNDKPIIYENIVSWNAGTTKSIIEAVYNREDFYNHMIDLHDGVENGFKILKERGYEIIIDTKSSLKSMGYKANLLDKLLGDYIDGWIFQGTNKNVSTGKNQWDMSVSNNEGFSILFDDHIKNITCDNNDKYKHHMPTYCICGKLAKRKDEEWNIDWQNEKFTIYHWNELSEKLDMIENFENIIHE